MRTEETAEAPKLVEESEEDLPDDAELPAGAILQRQASLISFPNVNVGQSADVPTGPAAAEPGGQSRTVPAQCGLYHFHGRVVVNQQQQRDNRSCNSQSSTGSSTTPSNSTIESNCGLICMPVYDQRL